MKYIISHTFKDFKICTIKVIGSGYDSVAYLVNNEYIFKIKISANKKKGYIKEKAILDFLNKYLISDIKIPKIEYSYISDEFEIMGYKSIDGRFLTPKIYENMTDKQKDILKNDIAKFLKKLHNLDYSKISEYSIDNRENVLESELKSLRKTGDHYPKYLLDK